MAFEYAFHYLGNFERDTKAALRERGYEVKRFRHKPPQQQKSERPPAQRTLQNLYMPLQQVGFDPLLMASGVNAPATVSGTTPPLQPASPQKRKTTAKRNGTTTGGKTQKTTSVASLIPSSFSTYLGKALSTGIANSPQEVQQFLQSVLPTVPQQSESAGAGKRVSQPLRKVNEPVLRERLGCTRTVPGSAKSESGQREKVKSTVGQGALSAELQSAADRLYARWKQLILQQKIKPTYRPGKALLNQYLCQDKQRQTPTPLELDSITRHWFERALQETVILPNQQQGRGHARYVVNPDRVITEA